ncbi:ABC transporter substrate-binding protein [Longimycelium tulufanense]|uniref:ABC transporter substrate-binding protein n=1 Tax=Longimycelium tulufanense TaxID=907463 RepID=A0A8J3C801_9PSEU|nr:MCE family protein [Longimycelium tulufanense]GGM52096.1 ABC transporter substrate-binding protein [Longimycelium tulufanense]
MITTALGNRLARIIALGCVLALVVAFGMWWGLHGPQAKRITAYFGSAVGVYEGSDVRTLGVKVGEIVSVEPEGRQVRVGLTIDRDVKVPADAQAVVVAPSVVSDRYVQLAPVYRDGPELGDDAVIPRERTATPVELDEVYASLDQLATALGPNGANRDGAFSELLRAGAANLDGNGQAMHDTIRQLGQASRTLSGNRDDLFATVDQLQKFTTMLAGNDGQVRSFNTQLAEVNRFLATERDDLGTALRELATALERVRSFVRDNRDVLKSNVDKLADITQVLVDQRAALAESLDVAPLALGNLQNAYNAASGTLDTRADLNELTDPPLVLICKTIRQTSPSKIPPALAEICQKLRPVVDGVAKLPSPAQALEALHEGHLPQLPLPLVQTLNAGAAPGTPTTPSKGGR